MRYVPPTSRLAADGGGADSIGTPGDQVERGHLVPVAEVALLVYLGDQWILAVVVDHSRQVNLLNLDWALGCVKNPESARARHLAPPTRGQTGRLSGACHPS